MINIGSISIRRGPHPRQRNRIGPRDNESGTVGIVEVWRRTELVVTVGTNNRERRRAKQKAREERQRRLRERTSSDQGSGPSPFGGPPFGGIFSPGGARVSPADLVEAIARHAVEALHAKNDEAVRRHCAALTDTGPGGRRLPVDAALPAILQRELTGVWRRGWQPADVVRSARREYGARQARMVVDVIAAEMRQYAATTVDERWEAQLRELDATVWWERDDGYLAAVGERDGIERADLIRCALEVLHIFTTCPDIQVLCPPPGRARRGPLAAAGPRDRSADPRQLDRVRALLAKAESTTFPEEAEAYTAKAQELMARHSIDHALLSVGSHAGEQPSGRRIGVDNPYEAPKVLLLNEVASANRCRTVWSQHFGFVTVLGFDSDIDAVELLFTSLLVQATAAMVRAGTRRDAYGRSSTRSFRQSFLTAYAQRIGERLTEATRQVTEQVTEEAGRDATGGAAARQLLPVLASRDRAVDAMVDDLFPGLSGKSVTVSNREGWASGRAAADHARLATRHAVDAGP
jgi:hypothetical protein